MLDNLSSINYICWSLSALTWFRILCSSSPFVSNFAFRCFISCCNWSILFIYCLYAVLSASKSFIISVFLYSDWSVASSEVSNFFAFKLWSSNCSRSSLFLVCKMIISFYAIVLNQLEFFLASFYITFRQPFIFSFFISSWLSFNRVIGINLLDILLG